MAPLPRQVGPNQESQATVVGLSGSPKNRENDGIDIEKKRPPGPPPEEDLPIWKDVTVEKPPPTEPPPEGVVADMSLLKQIARPSEPPPVDDTEHDLDQRHNYAAGHDALSPEADGSTHTRSVPAGEGFEGSLQMSELSSREKVQMNTSKSISQTTKATASRMHKKSSREPSELASADQGKPIAETAHPTKSQSLSSSENLSSRSDNASTVTNRGAAGLSSTSPVSDTLPTAHNVTFPKGRRPPPGLPPRPDTNTMADLLTGVSKTNEDRDEEDEMQEPMTAGDEVSGPSQNQPSLPSTAQAEKQLLAAHQAPRTAWDRPPNDQAMPGDSGVNAEDLKTILTPGRLSIRCIEGANIRRKDQTKSQTNLNPFLRFAIESNSDSHPCSVARKTKVREGSGQNPSFENEIVSFDMMDPTDLVCDNDVKLKVQLWDNNAWNEDLLGEVTLSVARFLTSRQKSDEWLPLIEPGDKSSNSKLRLEFFFEEVKTGLVAVTLFEGKEVGGPYLSQQQSVSFYADLSVGEARSSKSRTIWDGGPNPFFGEEEILLWVDESNWFNDLSVKLCQAKESGDDSVAEQHMSLLQYMRLDDDAS